MKTIQSFTINHDILGKGMYTSRVDGDVVTYDIRMKIPNNPEEDYLTNGAAHTFEHLFATYAVLFSGARYPDARGDDPAGAGELCLHP